MNAPHHKTSKGKKTPRPPVIAVMGHIDHGKSTLLDYIRKSNVTAGEAGGITQHLGAYETFYSDAKGVKHRLTFLDTPGHEAFSAIRERSALVADVAVLVISGEDGVKPQTEEALSRIKKAGIPFVVAINKIDRPGVDAERMKANLAEHEIYVEGYGGDVPCIPVSALTGKGVPELLEMLSLLSDLQGLTCDNSKKASGALIEAHRDSKKGIAATLLIKNGTLSVGDFVVSGGSVTPVHAIRNDAGEKLTHASASTPVQIVGWNKLPSVGSPFATVSSRNEAEQSAERATSALETARTVAPEGAETENTAIVPIVIKADTVGSLEAVRHEIENVDIEGVQIKILLEGVGAIGENDVNMAAAGTKPLIIGFQVNVASSATSLAERRGIQIATFDIIYRLTEWLLLELETRRPRKEVLQITAEAKMLKLFSAEKGKYVIGGRVETGALAHAAVFKIMRRDVEIGQGKIRNLQQQKTKVEEVSAGKEFGAMIEAKVEPAPGDKLVAFVTTLQ